MKNIKERAEASRATRRREQIDNNAPIEKFMGDVYVNGYINGAIEQKQIDIERAAKWLIERTMFGVHPCGGKQLVEDFKKEMEL